MNSAHDNILSRIEREYVSFLFDQARRNSKHPVTIDQLIDFLGTPHGQKGLKSFKAMRSKQSKPRSKKPVQIGVFL